MDNTNMADNYKHINGWGIDADPERTRLMNPIQASFFFVAACPELVSGSHYVHLQNIN